jgi:hypothetical protein
MRGQGALGFRSGELGFEQYSLRSSWSKLALSEVRLSKLVTGWSVYSGSAYSAPAATFSYRGRSLDVVAVRLPDGTRLTRVADKALVASTESSFWFDPGEDIATKFWDDGVTAWDDGSVWDQYRRLIVHLPDDKNPNKTYIVALLSFHFASAPCNYPSLGEQMLLNGDLAEWTSSTNCDDWTETAPAGSSVEREETIPPPDLTYGVRLTHDGAGNQPSFSQTQTLVAGMTYLLSGWYAVETNSGRVGTIKVTAGGDPVQEDGKQVGAAADAPMLGEGEPKVGWRRFGFAFIAPGTSATISFETVAHAAPAAGKSVTLRLGRLALKPIWRHAFWEPRIAVAPSSSVHLQSHVFGGSTAGGGNLDLINADGWLDDIAGRYDVLGGEVLLWLGSTDVGIESFLAIGRGVIRGFRRSDDAVSIAFSDIRSVIHRALPPRVYSVDEQDGIDGTTRGKTRPFWTGRSYGIPPLLITSDEVTGYGTYEVTDCGLAPNGIYSLDVYAYLKGENKDRSVDDKEGIEVDSRRKKLFDASILHPTDWWRELNATTGVTSTTDDDGVVISAPDGILTRDGSSAWTAGAVSKQMLTGDGYVLFRGSDDAVIMACGLDPDDTVNAAASGDYDTIDYCWYLDNTGGGSTIKVYENGVQKYTSAAFAVTSASRFKVAVEDGEVLYYFSEDGVTWDLKYTSVTVPVPPLLAVAAIYTADASLQAEVYGFGHYASDLAQGQLSILTDVQLIEIEANVNDSVDVAINASAYCGFIEAGLWTPIELALAIQQVVRAAASSTAFYCRYSEITHLMTFGVTAGTLQLLCHTGAYVGRSVYKAVGVTDKDDKSGATSYVSDTALSTDYRAMHILRCDGCGYKDDASGTYTGTANARIWKAPDMWKMVWHCILRRPLDLIDDVSFAAARSDTYAGVILTAYLNEEGTTQEFLQTLEESTQSIVSMNGEGQCIWICYSATPDPKAPPVIGPAILDTFEDGLDDSEVHGKIRVQYWQTTTQSAWRTLERLEAAARTDRYDTREVNTFLPNRVPATRLGVSYADRCKLPSRRFRCEIRGALSRAYLGQVVSLTRQRGLDSSGLLDQIPCRVTSLTPNFLSATMKADLVEVL